MDITFSYCLFGSPSPYDKKLLEVLKNANVLMKTLSGSHQNIVFVDNSVNEATLSQIRRTGALIRQLGFEVSSSFEGMTSRYLAIIEGTADLVIVRDCDSHLTMKELAIIRHFIASKFDFYTIRDCSKHVMPIMGGLFGLKASMFEDFKKIFFEHFSDYSSGFYGFDQLFLARHIYPSFKRNTIVYSSSGVYPGENVREIDQSDNFIGSYISGHSQSESSKGKVTYYPFILAKALNFRMLGKLKCSGWHGVNIIA